MRYALLVTCLFILSVARGDDLPAPTPDAAPAHKQVLADITPSEAYKDQVFTESDLMVGGKRIVDPLRHGLIYYSAPEWLIWQNPANFGKQSGLLLSQNGGKTWQVLSRQFKFKHLFIHPITGEFFAIIEYQWLQTNTAGYLDHCFADKIVRSTDGKRWRDITRGHGYIADLVAIFQDPEHPNRICVRACVISDIIYQYTDDNYSDWKSVRGEKWIKAASQTEPLESTMWRNKKEDRPESGQKK